MTTGYNDGSAGAPAGNPQMPGLLDGYAAVPPWQVAGVDYAVGIPADTTLLNPATIAMAGVTVNQTAHIITINASNVTLNGYDFGVGGGWGIAVDSGATNTVIENSHFLVGANENVPVQAYPGSGNLTLLNNVFDGGSQTSDAVWALVSYSGSGTFTAEYNSFLNSPSDAIDFNSGTMTTVVQYNLFDNLGTSPGAHPNSVQYESVTSNNSVIAFNTIYQPNPSGLQGVQLQAQGGSDFVNTTIDNNVIVAKGPSPSIDMSYSIAVIQNSGNTIDGVNVSDNYIDDTGAYGPFYPPTGTNLVFANNVNMTTGATLANPHNTTTGTNTVASVTASPASGTETDGDTIVIRLLMNEAFTVTGTPALLLNDGGKALYTGGSGTDKLSFQYTVAAADSAVSSLAITGVALPSSATVTDASGNAANFAGAVTAFSGLGIVPPTGPVVVPASAATLENQPVAIAVLSMDNDPSSALVPSSVAITAAPAHGTTAINTANGEITYTPATGYHGTDTFRYTVADSLGIVSAPDMVTVTVAQTTGDGSGYADGATSAPAGTPQLPNILSSYATTPPWAVAGVNYANGVPSGTTLKDPTVSGNLPTGATYNASTHTVTVTGNNVDLGGFNFSLHGGIELVIQSNNVTVQDSLFEVGVNQGSLGRVVNVTTNAGNVTFLDNEFNGNNVPVTAQAGQMLMVQNHGTFTFDYNYVHDTGGDAIDFSSGPQSDVVEYNLFENMGGNTAHADTLQWYDSQVTSGLIAFDTVYQDMPQPGPGNGALTVLSEGPTATMANMVVENDTIVQTGSTSPSGATTGNFTTGFYADAGGTASNVTIHDLYIDPTGAENFTGMWLLPTGFYGDELATHTAITGVTNMVSGTTYTTLPKAQGYYVAPDANGISPALSDVIGITASPASGTEIPGDTISFTLSMDEAFTVAGTPELLLNNGGTATYASGSGTSALTFQYTIPGTAKLVSSLGITGVSLPSGATVKDSVGNEANLSDSLAFSGLNIANPALCFCAGTMIATPEGEAPVECLSIGDTVRTVRGRERRIIWVGSGRVLATQGRRNAATPVIVRKGALAHQVPHRDLHVTNGHALYLDGVLIPVEELINQQTILWDDRAQEVSIFHIELDSHDVLIANGAAAESYRDDGNRWLFQNADRGWHLPPQAPYAPLLSDGPVVDGVWQRLLQRAGRSQTIPLTDDPDLHLLIDSRRVDPIERQACGTHVFRLPAKPRSVRLRSRAAVPQHLGLARDPRPLGVPVRRLVLAQARHQRSIEAGSATLIDGFYDYEPADGIRWTDGDAAVPRTLFAGMSGPGMLIVDLCGATQYLDDARVQQVA